MNFLIGLLGQVASLIAGGIGGAISMVTSLVKTSYKQVLQYNQQGIALARQMGLNAKEAQAYTSTLITRAKDLGKAYGIAAEQVVELQKNITNATSKQYMLNDAEAETMVQINKLVGSDVMNTFASEMMNGMGGQLSAVQGAVSKAYATAAKSGLNAAQFSEKVAKNLSMANRLSFKDGVNGIIRMTALSEKLGINMASVESAAKNFMDLDKAIENAAHMQMLGGSAAVNFGNPLTAAYEANYDPEAFAKRMSDSLASYATFDANKGYASINGMNMDFVRQIAKAMGISEEDAVKNAKKQSEVKYKEGAFGATLGQYNQQQRDFILNKSYVENGKLMINDASGNKHDISSGKLSDNMLQEMMKFTNMDDSELMRQQALSLTSIEERITGWETSFFATIADKISNFLPQIENIVNYIGEFATSEIAPKIAKGVEDVGKWLVGHGDDIKNIADTLTGSISSALNFFSQSWRWLKVTLGLIGASYLFKGYQWIKNLPIQGQAIRDKFRWGNGGGSPAAAMPNGGGGSPAAATAQTPKPTAQTKPTINSRTPVNVGGKDYRFDNRGRLQVKNGNNWQNTTKRVTNANKSLVQAKQLEQAYLNPSASQSSISNATANSARQASNTVSTASNSAKSGGFLSKLKSFGSGASKFAKIGGGVLGAGLAIGQGAMALVSYKNQKEELAQRLANGEINENDYNAQLASAKTERNESVGGSIGMGVGTAIGTALGGPIGAAIGGLIGQYGGQYIGKHWEDIKGFAKSAWESTKEMASSVWGGIKDLAKGAWSLVPEDARKSISSAFSSIAPITEGAWSVIKGQSLGTFKVIKGAALGAWSAIKGAGLGAWEIIKGAGLGIWEVVKGIWNGLWDIIAAPFQAIGDVVNGFKEGINQMLDGRILDGITSIFKGIGKGLLDVVSSPFKAIYDVGVGVVNGLGEYIKGIYKGISEYVKGIWKGVGDFVNGIWNGILSVWYGIANALNKLPWFNIDVPKEHKANGGIVGGNSYSGDKIITGLNSREMVLNTGQQAALFNFINKIPNILGNVQTVNSNAYSNVTSYRTVNNPLSNIINSSPVNMMSRLLTNNNDNSNTSNVTSYRANYNSDTFAQRIYNSLLANNNSISKPNNVSNMMTSMASNALANSKTDISSPNNVSNMMTSMVSSILTNQNDVRTKPVGDKEYIYVPKNSETSNVNGNKISVNDFNINLSGTIKLDGGNNSKNVDVNALLNDFSFMNALKEMIKTSINNDMNGGRYMNDLATMRGHISSMSSFGR